MIYLLIASLNSYDGPTAMGQIAVTDLSPPLLRHTPPSPPNLGETRLIQAVVEDESEIKRVYFRYRASGKRAYHKILLTPVSGNRYEARLEATKAFKKGIEYYIEAVDQFGNKGADGSKERPYFLVVRGGKRIKPAWWESRWFWIGVALAIGTGIIAATVGGQEEGSGTVVVQ